MSLNNNPVVQLIGICSATIEVDSSIQYFPCLLAYSPPPSGNTRPTTAPKELPIEGCERYQLRANRIVVPRRRRQDGLLHFLWSSDAVPHVRYRLAHSRHSHHLADQVLQEATRDMNERHVCAWVHVLSERSGRTIEREVVSESLRDVDVSVERLSIENLPFLSNTASARTLWRRSSCLSLASITLGCFFVDDLLLVGGARAAGEICLWRPFTVTGLLFLLVIVGGGAAAFRFAGTRVVEDTDMLADHLARLISLLPVFVWEIFIELVNQPCMVDYSRSRAPSPPWCRRTMA